MSTFRSSIIAVSSVFALCAGVGCNVAPPPPPLVCGTAPSLIDSDTRLGEGCYDVLSDITVRDGATLTLDPGVTLRFRQNTGLSVSSDGRLAAMGTEDDPILLTGSEKLRGFWAGVDFMSSNSNTNELSYVIIEYGGGGTQKGNLVLNGTAAAPTRIAMDHCTLRHSATFGFYFDADSIVDTFSTNTLTDNADGAGSLTATLGGLLDDATTYVGNDKDIVEVRAGLVDTDQTWPALGGDYLIAGSVTVDAGLTLSPGASLMFSAGTDMRIQDGSLSAIGTATEPIVFTGEETTRGSWAGLRVDSNSLSNRLEYVTVEYGGVGSSGANLFMGGIASAPSRIAVANTTFRESAGYGFIFDDDALVDEFSTVTSTSNALGAGKLAPNVAGFLEDTGTYTGNDNDFVEITGGGGVVSADQTWAGIDAPYLVATNIDIKAAVTIEPGAEFVMAAGRDITVHIDGSLNAVGTAADQIIFTGKDPTPGFWVGLNYTRSLSENNRLEHVIIEYAGGGTFDGGLLIDGIASQMSRVEVVDSIFRNSASWGIALDDDAIVNNDIATANTFSENADGDVLIP